MKDSGVSWIGEIPADWELSKIGSLYAERSQKVSDQDYMPLSVTKQGIVPQLESAAKTDHSDSRKLIRKGDFVINSRSDRRGACGISQYDGSCSLINTVLRPRREMSNVYFSFVFRSDLFADEFYRWGNGIVDDLWSTKWSSMKRIYVPFPPLNVQRQIAAYLDTKCAKIDAIITRQQQVIEKLKAYKLSVITEAVTKGLNSDVPMKDSGIEWIGMMPAHWDILKLQAHTRMLTPMRDRPEKLDGDIPWVRIEDYDGKYISASKEGLGVSPETVREMNLKIYPIGSILCTSSCDLGKCAIVTRELVSNQRFINIIPDSDTNSDYLYYLMLSNAERLNHLSTGTIQANLSRKAFEHLMVQFPPNSEQTEIAEYLDGKCSYIDDIIQRKQALIDKLTEYKKSLIYEVVTGKREITEDLSSVTGVVVLAPALIAELREKRAALMTRFIDGLGDKTKGRTQIQKCMSLAEGLIDF